MVLSIRSALLKCKTQAKEAIRSRLEDLQIRRTASNKTLLQMRAEEARKEDVFIRAHAELERVCEIIEEESSPEKVAEEVEKLCTASSNRRMHTKEFFKFVLERAQGRN
ncbi:uncharacterized protein NEMAJ01_0659 [Nematocida major]|uniref:uncharacterized protein n=1 Tax=Nematocida major TaxID=1912982 RepID=UPI0020079017|nr:uncharacterized protein NEMAJ01_0659 [Nematocida major]KAH9385763.1 hypothetical protein NEMAJ01_0659 [Nematocida major]